MCHSFKEVTSRISLLPLTFSISSFALIAAGALRTVAASRVPLRNKDEYETLSP